MMIPGSNTVLTARQENFCRAYMSVGEPTFCNVLKAYDAAGYKMNDNNKKISYSNAREVFLNPKIQTRLAELMEMAGFNNLAVNAEHLKVLRQDKDLSNKMKAIAEYNKMMGRTQTDSGPGKITINIVNFEDNGNNNSAPIQSQRETVSVRDLGEQGQEQGVSYSSESWEDSDSGEQADNGSGQG